MAETSRQSRQRLPSRAWRSWTALTGLSGIIVLCCGCPATESLPSQSPVTEVTEPRTQQHYLLYVPSAYSDQYDFPLVVACHGTWPYDTAELQMREWAKFGENNGVIVAAPKLLGTKGDFPPSPEEQIALQQKDEALILAMVSEIKRKYKVAEHQVFMTGWSAGAYAILHTGLRNPDVFRALAVRQGSFDQRFLDVHKDRIDPWQKILVIYGMTDLLRDQSKAMLDWLRAQGLHPNEREIAGTHRRIDPKLPWGFFEDVVKKSPWVCIRVWPVDAEKPLEVRFQVDAIPKVIKQKWFFGDGGESYDASPIHTYARRGSYEVAVNVAMEDGKTYSRRRTIGVTRR